jgi:hypothetical protein
LHGAQAYSQEQHADEDIKQWKNEISQAGFDDEAMIDGQNIRQPVGPDQHGGGEIEQEGSAVHHGAVKIVELPHEDKEERQDDKPPNNMMTNYLHGINLTKSFPANGQRPQMYSTTACAKPIFSWFQVLITKTRPQL